MNEIMHLNSCHSAPHNLLLEAEAADPNQTGSPTVRTSPSNDLCDQTSASLGLLSMGSSSHTEHSSVEADTATIVVIERRTFFRDCIAHFLQSAAGLTVKPVASVAEWLELSKSVKACLVVLCRSGASRDQDTRDDIAALAMAYNPAPTIILSDREGTDAIVEALEAGAHGYIPTTLSLEVALGAMRLVRAGGTFVPAASLIAAHKIAETVERDRRPSTTMFTARQIAVVEALRRGKANKLIAYELNMCESTVKVHVRNIMKKLKAKNRTQVAFMATELLRGETRA